jgi:uncharacterized FAD-dependent dehydrogenase
VLRWNVFKRSYDARKRQSIHLIYTVDVDLEDEAAIEARAPAHVARTPDMRYRFVARAPADWPSGRS